MERNFLDKDLEAPCRENFGTYGTKSVCRFGKKLLLPTQPYPTGCDKAQCTRSARRFGAVGSSPDFSRVFFFFFYGTVLPGLCICLETISSPKQTLLPPGVTIWGLRLPHFFRTLSYWILNRVRSCAFFLRLHGSSSCVAKPNTFQERTKKKPYHNSPDLDSSFLSYDLSSVQPARRWRL